MYKSRPIPLPSARDSGAELLSPAEFAKASGLSLSTVWRQLRRGELTSIKRKGRRFISADPLASASRKGPQTLTADHPIWKLCGAGRSGGAGPGSSDKHRYLAEEAEARGR